MPLSIDSLNLVLSTLFLPDLVGGRSGIGNEDGVTLLAGGCWEEEGTGAGGSNEAWTGGNETCAGGLCGVVRGGMTGKRADMVSETGSSCGGGWSRSPSVAGGLTVGIL